MTKNYNPNNVNVIRRAISDALHGENKCSGCNGPCSSESDDFCSPRCERNNAGGGTIQKQSKRKIAWDG